MEGQISIFDLIKSVPEEWERFRDEFCKKQGGYMRFDENGRVTNNKDFEVVKGCCFTNKNIKEPWDNWQPCTFDNCPLRKERKDERNRTDENGQ